MAAMTIQEAQALATRQLQAGRLADAEAIYRQILAVRPDHADTLHMLGVALHQSGRHAEAMELIRRAIAINPNQADYHANLGVMLGGQNRLDEAIASVQTAIGLRPDAPESHLNLGNLFRMKGRMGEAIAEYQKTVALRPNYADAYNNLGGALKDSGRFDEAIAAYRQAVALRPDPRISSNLAYLVHFLPDSDRRQILEEHRRWSEAYAKPVAPLVGPHENNPDPDRRLRVGYVSPDFREHPVGRFLLPLLSHHDHSRFEIFCYSDVGRPDAVTNCIRSHTDVWRQTLVASDEQLAQLVRQDQIDLLVDLSLHMSGHRLLAFARKPAPVQVTYLAYCSTSGVHAIDYRISDPYLDPQAPMKPATPSGPSGCRDPTGATNPRRKRPRSARFPHSQPATSPSAA